MFGLAVLNTVNPATDICIEIEDPIDLSNTVLLRPPRGMNQRAATAVSLRVRLLQTANVRKPSSLSFVCRQEGLHSAQRLCQMGGLTFVKAAFVGT